MLKQSHLRSQPSRERSRFAFVKAMLLASAAKRVQSGVTLAAQFGVDGHLVELSEELVMQKPSLVQSRVWEVTAKAKSAMEVRTGRSAGEIRVCWQCPESPSIVAPRKA